MRVGILGGGQLGRMLALEGYPLGLRFRFLESKEDPPVAPVGTVTQAEYDDVEAALRFARGLDVVTYEFENVPVETARALSEQVPVHPAPAALEMAQDRLVEKDGFRELGIPTAPYARVDDRDGLDDALDQLGTPAVLKTRRFGYDGKGQVILEDPEEADGAWDELGETPLILEGFVDYARELSILAVRSRDGRTISYPLVENHHEEGILRLSIAPAPLVTPELQALAEDHARKVLVKLDYVGVLAIEFFQVADTLLANEMAPRVHNSGHWTLDGARYSQFENHVRAVCGLPLASTEARGHSAMLNLLGRVPSPGRILGLEGAHLHLYEKSPRPRRKLGHVNLAGDDPRGVRERLDALERIVADAGGG